MSDTMKELRWYSERIEQERKECDRLWSEYSGSRARLNVLERDRNVVFSKLIQDAESRIKRSA